MTFLGTKKGLMKQEGVGCVLCHHGDAGSKVIIKTFLHQKAIFTSGEKSELLKWIFQKKKKIRAGVCVKWRGSVLCLHEVQSLLVAV